MGSNYLTTLFENYNAIVVFDVETSGLDPYRDQIIELAAQKLYIKDGALWGHPFQCYISLYDNHKIPQAISNINHITEELLLYKGVSIEYAIEQFLEFSDGRKTLFVAHNINFDMAFLNAAALHVKSQSQFQNFDLLDTLTVYKDRAPFPHKLSNAISRYGLTDFSQNTHQANDDVNALVYVLLSMAKERDDLLQYVNLIGYNPKYPPKYRLKNATYIAQPYNTNVPLYKRRNEHCAKVVGEEFLIISRENIDTLHTGDKFPPFSQHRVLSDNKGDYYAADIHRSDFWESYRADNAYRFPSNLTAPVHFQYSEKAQAQASSTQESLSPKGENEFQQFVRVPVSYHGLGSGYLISVSKDQVVFHRTTDKQEYTFTINDFLTNGSFDKILDARAFEDAFHKKVMWQGRRDRPNANHERNIFEEFYCEEEIDMRMDDNFYIGDGDDFGDLND